jgi:hypothetical protein
MKQIRPFFLFLTTLLLLQSCTDEEMQEPALKTTSIQITTYSPSLTGKNVNDPAIFGNIKDITVTATQTASSYKASTLFTISNNTNDSSVYTIDNVLVGINTIEATATSVSAPIAPSFFSIQSTDANSAVWNTIDTHVASPPYATYTGSMGPILIDVDTPTKLMIPMNTNNGRFIAYFRVSTSKNNLKTTVTPYIDNVAQASFNVTNTLDFYWIWNDPDCINGKTIRFSCLTTNNGGQKQELLTTPTITIKSHTTNKNTYDILGNGESYATIPRN